MISDAIGARLVLNDLLLLLAVLDRELLLLVLLFEKRGLDELLGEQVLLPDVRDPHLLQSIDFLSKLLAGRRKPYDVAQVIPLMEPRRLLLDHLIGVDLIRVPAEALLDPVLDLLLDQLL